MQPAETTYKILHVRDATGAGVTGLVTGSFTFTAYANGVAYTHSSAITEIGSGDYLWTFLEPSSAKHKYVRAVPTNSAYRCALTSVRSVAFEGEIEANDLDSIYAASVKPVVSLTSQGTIGQQVPISCYFNRYQSIVISCVDSAGVAINMATAYNNYKVAVKSQDQATTTWAGTGATLTGGSGTLTITIPETAGFFAALTTGVDSISLYWEVTGDLGSDATKTVPIVPSSPLTLTRSEV